MKPNERIVYSLNVIDIQTVAEEELGRKLKPKEIEMVERKLGDFIDWSGVISLAIQNTDISE